MTTGQVVFASHDHRLVALSVVISILGAYAAQALADRLSTARGRPWLAWLIGGATADGIGTWSMHYTGKLALRLPVPVRFDPALVVLSLFVGIAGSGGALLIASRSRMGWARSIVAGIFLGGVGISGLHYTAMASMRVEGMHHIYYSPALVALSIVLAIAFASLPLALTFHFREYADGRRFRNHAAALLRGSANPVMHYTAMAAVAFVYARDMPELSRGVSISPLGIVGITIVPAMVLVVALLTSLMDRLQRGGGSAR